MRSGAVLALFLCVAAAAAAQALNPQTALAQTHKDLASARAEARRVRAEIATQRKRLLEELAAARKHVRRLQAEVEALQAAVARLRGEAPEGEAALAAAEREEERLAAVLANAARSLWEAERHGLLVLEHPDLGRSLADLTGARRAPTETEEALDRRAARLFAVAARLLAESALVARFRAPVAAPEGRLVEADVLRLGQVMAFARTGKEAGVLLRTGSTWRTLPLPPSYRAQPLFRHPPPDTFPLDPTGGLALTGPRPLTAGERFRAGGPVMYPIAGGAFLAALLFLERLLFYARAARRLRRLEGGFAAGDPPAALQAVAGPLAPALEAALRHGAPGPPALEAGLRAVAPRLERALGFLALLGTVAPFLGLLGTVTGMIHTFDTITRVGTGDARLLAAGIAEALITTQAGLLVAIPILLIHAYLDGRADHLHARLASFLERLLTAQEGGEHD